MTVPTPGQGFFLPVQEQRRFPQTSRYHTTGTAIHTAADGTPVPYLLRRFPPQPARLATIGSYTAAAPDRRDLAASTALGRAELWWRLADGAGAFDPDTVVDQPGAPVRLTLDESEGG
ncbi:MAG: LysM domain-containing protein [Alphaproteobacteria bacterium]|nr:LysM domain-containing protein [Alphaproteobacteria bacterium]MCB9929448.1 LysM domain-containing protein [Alphaproteobacteria bacterium]